MHVVQFSLYRNQDVIRAARAILEAAETGRLIGLAGGLIFQRGGWTTVIGGQARNDPIVAIGVVHNLKLELADIANGKQPPLNR